MASNTIELIKVLRDRTGAGMLDCRNALVANNNDVEKSIEWLREKGIAKVAKKSSRIAAEGLTYVVSKGNEAIILELNSETDFVAKSDAFKDLIHKVGDVLLENKPATLEAGKELVSSLITDATIKIGEKMDLRRFNIVSKTDAQTFGTYMHMGGKISVLTVLNGVDNETAKGIAMHIAANNPAYIETKDIPAEAIENEKKVQLEAAKADPKLSSKPEAVLLKILEGKVHKVFSESVLAEQAYLMDPDGGKVGAYLKNKQLSVVSFIRYQVGEGLAKREENFADEVAAQMK